MKKNIRMILGMFVVLFLIGCASTPPPKKTTPTPKPTQKGLQQTGKASFYAMKYHGRKTASGERFNQRAMTAAHRKLPFGTMVLVTNLENGKSVKVRVNDRGPFVKGRIIDLSRSAFSKIGDTKKGVIRVKIQVLK